MRYTRGVELKGDAHARLEELQIDKVAVQKDIFVKKLGGSSTVGVEREQLQEELDTVEERWGSGRSEEASDLTNRPFLTSEEWRAIPNGYGRARNSNRASTQIQHRETTKWQNWRAKPTKHQWGWLQALSLFTRRLPALESAEELGGYREKRRYRSLVMEKKKEIWTYQIEGDIRF